jgi:hypothetical protein
MRTIVLTITLILLTISAIGVFIGFDPKKWINWVYGVCGFLSGLLIGSLRNDLKGGIIIGVIFAIAIMVSGMMIHWQREYYGKKAESWLRQYGEQKQYSFLARLIRKILNK